MLFFPISIPFNSFFLLLFLSSVPLLNFILSHCRRGTRVYDDEESGEEEEEGSSDYSEEEDIEVIDNGCTKKDDLVGNLLGGGALFFWPSSSRQEEEDQDDCDDDDDDEFDARTSSTYYVSESAIEVEKEDEITNNCSTEESDEEEAKPIQIHTMKSSQGLTRNKGKHIKENGSDSYYYRQHQHQNHDLEQHNSSFQDEGFVLIHPRPQAAKSRVLEDESADNGGGGFAGGSTSHSSYEWRSSTYYRSSETEDPFSSSSRRSSSKWESYTMYKKYDEDMMCLDRISAQKLIETESLRSMHMPPRSVSQRVVRMFNTKNMRFGGRNMKPYQELEATYVGQMCLAWEALNWNYNNFIRSRASRRVDEDPGCLAHIAQQFQQFQVLLQRFIETEPYEHGHRPEIYARMRKSSPKLLQVPEFQDSESDGKKEDPGGRIPSMEFLLILEGAIRTFMNFLRADKRSHCQILRNFFRKSQRSDDPTYLHLLKKANKRNKMRIKDLRRGGICFRKRRLREDEEMAILMALIDFKVVSRVLRMSDITFEQLKWCEEKMTQIRISDGKLKRDSSTLLFPSL